MICFKGTGSKVSKLKTGHTTIGAQAAKAGEATADGVVTRSDLLLAQVRLGPLQARDVEAVVIDSDMPYVLYGNSFLQGFRLQWEQGRLSLTP